MPKTPHAFFTETQVLLINITILINWAIFYLFVKLSLYYFFFFYLKTSLARPIAKWVLCGFVLVKARVHITQKRGSYHLKTEYLSSATWLLALKSNFAPMQNQHVPLSCEQSLHIWLVSLKNLNALLWANLRWVHWSQGTRPENWTFRQGDRLWGKTERRNLREVCCLFFSLLLSLKLA